MNNSIHQNKTINQIGQAELATEAFQGDVVQVNKDKGKTNGVKKTSCSKHIHEKKKKMKFNENKSEIIHTSGKIVNNIKLYNTPMKTTNVYTYLGDEINEGKNYEDTKKQRKLSRAYNKRNTLHV